MLLPAQLLTDSTADTLLDIARKADPALQMLSITLYLKQAGSQTVVVEAENTEAVHKAISNKGLFQTLRPAEGGKRLIARWSPKGRILFLSKSQASLFSVMLRQSLPPASHSGAVFIPARQYERCSRHSSRMQQSANVLFYLAQLGSARHDQSRQIEIPPLTLRINEIRTPVLRKFFLRTLQSTQPSLVLGILQKQGWLQEFLPELEKARGLSQNKYHSHDIYYHCLYACDAATPGDAGIRAAALFHDLGKVDTRRLLPDGQATFHNHEILSERHARRILSRLQFAPAFIERVCFLVRNHMFHYTGNWTDRAIRRFLRKTSLPDLKDLIALRLADRKGSGKRKKLPGAIYKMIRHIRRVEEEDARLKVSDLRISGQRLMEMGLKPGAQMGLVLQELLQAVRMGQLDNEAKLLEERALAMIESGQSGKERHD